MLGTGIPRNVSQTIVHSKATTDIDPRNHDSAKTPKRADTIIEVLRGRVRRRKEGPSCGPKVSTKRDLWSGVHHNSAALEYDLQRPQIKGGT